MKGSCKIKPWTDAGGIERPMRPAGCCGCALAAYEAAHARQPANRTIIGSVVSTG